MDTAADLRYGVRLLRRNAGWSSTATLLLALGIGATTAVFTVANALLIQPLPWPDPDRLLFVHQIDPKQHDVDNFATPNFLDLQASSSSFAALTAYTGYWDPVLTGNGDAERVDGALASPQFTAVFAVAPALGTGFSVHADQPGANAEVLVSDGFWRSHLNADPGALGRTLELNGAPFTVVGIMPRGFHPPGELDAQLWGNLTLNPAGNRTGRSLRVIGRMQPGGSEASARAELHSIAATLEAAHPELQGFGISAMSLRKYLFGGTRDGLIALLGAAGLLLLIACANLSNLLIARGAARAREFAVRVALGASRTRIVRQLLAEALLLALCGGTAGVLLATWSTRLFVLMGPATLRIREVAVDPRVLAFAAVMAGGAALVASLAPALGALRTDVRSVLAEATRGTTSGGGLRLRALSTIFQVALSLVLMAAAGLLIRTFAALQTVDPGLDPQNVLTLSIHLTPASYAAPAAARARYEALVAETAGLPGVASAGLVSVVPFSDDYDRTGFAAAGQSYATPADEPTADRYVVTPGYRDAAGLRLLRGRFFMDADRAAAQPVVVIDEDLARTVWPGEDALGRQIIMPADTLLRTIVGIVAPVKQYGLSVAGRGALYLPLGQYARRYESLVLRTTGGDPLAQVESVRRVVREQDPALAVSDIATLRSLMSDAESSRRFLLALLGAFALIALTTSSIGLYGVLSFTVSLRAREIGVRLALGARTADVLRMVLGEGLALAACGVVLGVVGGVVAARTLAAQLYGVSATDVPTFLGAAALLLIVAIVASAVPAARAARVPPLRALGQS